MRKPCPKCKDRELEDVARGVSKCPHCGGSFVAPGATPETSATASAAPPEPSDARGGRCPSDRTIMTRTEVHLGPNRPPLHLERCSSCRSIWFDAGEWSALAERELIDHLDDLWSAEWRAEQRRVQNEESYQQRVRETFGSELYDTLQSLAGKLRGHERRSQALAFLREASED